MEAATPWSTVEAEAPAKEEEVCSCLLFPCFLVLGGWGIGWKAEEEERRW